MWEKKFIRNFLLVLCLLGVFIGKVFAEKSKSDPEVVTIRIGKHQGFVRIVFSTSDHYIQNSSITRSGNVIKINFKSPVIFKLIQKDGSKANAEIILNSSVPVEISHGIGITVNVSSCILTTKNLSDIKVLRLSKPARLVLDASVDGFIKEYSQEKTSITESVDKYMFNFFMLDAGHGGYDNGIRGKDFVEKDFTLAFTRMFADTLIKKGKKVFLTRKGDQVLSINERIKLINQKSPEIFFSIHVSSKDEFCIYYSDKAIGESTDDTLDSKVAKRQLIDIENISKAIAENIRTDLGISVRHEMLKIPIIEHVSVPAFLIELPNPDRFTYDKKIKEKMITAILKGLMHSSKGLN